MSELEKTMNLIVIQFNGGGMVDSIPTDASKSLVADGVFRRSVFRQGVTTVFATVIYSYCDVFSGNLFVRFSCNLHRHDCAL